MGHPPCLSGDRGPLYHRGRGALLPASSGMRRGFLCPHSVTGVAAEEGVGRDFSGPISTIAGHCLVELCFDDAELCRRPLLPTLPRRYIMTRPTAAARWR